MSKMGTSWFVGFAKPFELRGKLCYTFFVFDCSTEEILCYEAMGRPTAAAAQKVASKVFSQYGIPKNICTPQKGPFYSGRSGSLSSLDVSWIKNGISIDRLPNYDETFAQKIEQVQNRLREMTAKPYSKTVTEQNSKNRQILLKLNDRKQNSEILNFEKRENRVRSLGAESDINYPSGFRTEKVYPNGVISVDGIQLYVGHTLSGEFVGLKPNLKCTWEIFFGPVRLGYFDVTKVSKRGYRKFGKIEKRQIHLGDSASEI